MNAARPAATPASAGAGVRLSVEDVAASETPARRKFTDKPNALVAKIAQRSFQSSQVHFRDSWEDYKRTVLAQQLKEEADAEDEEAGVGGLVDDDGAALDASATGADDAGVSHAHRVVIREQHELSRSESNQSMMNARAGADEIEPVSHVKRNSMYLPATFEYAPRQRPLYLSDVMVQPGAARDPVVFNWKLFADAVLADMKPPTQVSMVALRGAIMSHDGLELARSMFWYLHCVLVHGNRAAAGQNAMLETMSHHFGTLFVAATSRSLRDALFLVTPVVLLKVVVNVAFAYFQGSRRDELTHRLLLDMARVTLFVFTGIAFQDNFVEGMWRQFFPKDPPLPSGRRQAFDAQELSNWRMDAFGTTPLMQAHLPDDTHSLLLRHSTVRRTTAFDASVQKRREQQEELFTSYEAMRDAGVFTQALERYEKLAANYKRDLERGWRLFQDYATKLNEDQQQVLQTDESVRKFAHGLLHRGGVAPP